MFSKCFFYRLKIVVLAGLLLFLTQQLSAQQKVYEVLINRIDSLSAAGLPKSALQEVEKLDQLSRKNHNSTQQIRAAVYRMNLQTYLEENALVAIINRLKLDIKQANFPVKPVLQSVLAEVYWKYYEQNRYQFAQRTTLEKPDADFTRWDLKTIIREVGSLYKQSLQNTQQEQNTSVAVLEGVLQGDKSTRNLRPALYDLLLHRALDFYLAEEPDLPKPRLAFSLNDPRLFGGDAVFINLKIAQTDTASVTYQGIKLLQQATIFHLQKQHPEALADLDLKRLEFLYRKASFPQMDSVYVDALQKVNREFQDKSIAADASVLLAQFEQQRDSLVNAVAYLQKAINSYPESLGGKNAKRLLDRINQQSLSAEIENVNLPDEPILAKLDYRNLQKANASVYRLTEEDLSELRKLENQNTYRFQEIVLNTDVLAFVKKLKPVQQQQISLPDPKDYRLHRLEFKIDALKPGFYVLLLSGENQQNDYLTSLANFRVTNLAYIGRQNPDESDEIRTVNRKTGAAMKGVKVNVANIRGGRIFENGLSDAVGKFGFHTSKNSSVAISLSVPGDFYTDNNSFYGPTLYQNNDSRGQTILFTDRQLYRPGQTIYFKGLQIITKGGKSEVVKDEKSVVILRDNNNKELGTVKVASNAFGTFSGSFILPQSLLNGNVILSANDDRIFVKVEEYKRPTFQIIFDAVKEAYHPGDSIKLKGKVLAFAGYGLAQTSVKFNVKSSQVEIGKSRNSNQINFVHVTKGSIDFLSDTITTNAKGEFVIRFKAYSDLQLELLSYYNIQAEVTNTSGETHVNSVTVNVATNPLKINLELPQKILITDSLKFPATLSNVNNQLQKGNLQVKIFSLKAPDQQITKKRLWEKPDQFLWDRQQFKQLFPTYAWQNEENFGSWTKDKPIAELNLKTDSNRLSMLDLSVLKQQPSGIYRIETYAKNSTGDTISSVQFVQFITPQNKPITVEDWAIPIVTKVSPGGKAVFLLGNGTENHILLEVLNGEKMLSSEWLQTGKAPMRKEIEVPLSARKNFRVQLLMVKDNRVYTLSQPIEVIQQKEQMNIRLLSFRNKLQPGEKEQWKLQVSGNEKQSVEMLAAMYDASLDDLAPKQNWTEQIQNLNQDYSPGYFGWNLYNFIERTESRKLFYKLENFELLTRQYEKLNLLGFNYYGGYNYAYQQFANTQRTNAIWAQTNQDNYLKSFNAYKNGFDVNGKIIDVKDKTGLETVSVKIKGTDIGVYTNASGHFKVHVPEKAILTISYLGYISQEVSVVKGVSPLIKLKPSSNSLNEVVVVGYGTQRKRDVTASMTVVEENSNAIVSFAAVDRKGDPSQDIRIRGTSTLQESVAGLNVRIDGKDFLQNTDVLQQSSKQSNPIQIRKNFNETAFFYPQLKTNEKGEILIDFTVPEALTKWRFKALAQTQNLKFAYLENEIITQKQLMVSANMPRFFREGDTVTVSAIVANLDAKKVSVKIVLQLFNGVNMQPANLLANAAEANQSIEIEANTNKAVSFKLIIPAGLDALTYRLTADAGKYSDGEENTIPVLPNSMLVTESVPMLVRPNQTKTFTLEKLLHNQSNTLQNKILTLEYTENPAWYAVQALPYLMEYPYECSEQTFNRYFANSLATSLVKKLPVIQQVFERWKTSSSAELLSNLEKNQELKSVLIEETPWLRDAENESEQKKRIALLFDLNKMGNELQINLDKLKQMQLANGSFPWFAGLRADRYITHYILAGIGQLYAAKAVDAQNLTLKNISDKALNYIDQELVKPEHAVFTTGKKLVPDNLSSIEIHGWYTRGYFAQKPMNEALKTAWKKYQQKANAEWLQRSVYEQGLIALTFLHFGQVKEAQQIIKSLIETSQQSEEMGMYWPKNTLGYFWYQNPIETQSLLIELFAEAGKSKEVEEMKIWLLRNKQTNNWKTTKATAQACYALLLRGENWLQPQGKTMLLLGDKNLYDLKPDLKVDAGTGYLKTTWREEQIKPELAKVEVKNQSNVISWGALYWQYLERLDKISSAKNSISLERKYFIRSKNNTGEMLVAVDKNHQPKVGDLLKIVVYLKADRDFEYVHLKDMRPAGTEPVDVLSGYKYQDGLYYYQVTKDVATNFFISYLPKGNYVFEYGLRVAQPGNFSTGISSVQSMYAPEFGAHSEGNRLEIMK